MIKRRRGTKFLAKSDEKFFHVMVIWWMRRDETILKQILILYFSLNVGVFAGPRVRAEGL